MENKNAMYIYVKKSKRKNAKTELLSFHFSQKNTTEEWEQVHKILAIAQKTVATAKKLNTSDLILNVNLFLSKETTKKTVNNPKFVEIKDFRYSMSPKSFYSIEELINYIHSLYMLINPNCKLSADTLYNDANTKYVINKFYHNDEIKEKKQ